MNTMRFILGPYDGRAISISDRMPIEIQLRVECTDADARDPSFLEAVKANLTPAELDRLVVARNLKEIIARHERVSDDDGAPYYRFAGWHSGGVQQVPRSIVG
jgi:hypothetical protein